MTKLKKFITESQGTAIDREEINFLISQHCQPYLKLLKGREPLYRGMGGSIKSGRKQVRTDRAPKGTPRTIFDNMNKWLKKNGHVPRDNAMIATSERTATALFGEAFYIFPIGPFKYSWIDAKDMNLDYGNWRTQIQDMAFEEEGREDEWSKTILKKHYNAETKEEAKLLFSRFIESNNGFNKAYNGGREIWFQCKEYYFIDWRSEPKGIWKKQ